MLRDKISCLPSDITDQILSRLPIRDAVRTSILSSKWRYKWTTLPDIVFDYDCVSRASEVDRALIKDKLVRVLDHVLFRHSGPINKLELSHPDLTAVDIGRWVLHLSRNFVNEFEWLIGGWDWDRKPYRMSSAVFDCQFVVSLVLVHCLLKPPPTFQGFRNLKNLHLTNVTLPQNVLENLISSCPLLERLKLLDMYYFVYLNIDAPNLWYFELNGNFKDVSFKSSFRLAEVSIYLDRILESGSSCDLLKFFEHLHHIRRLTVDGHFLKYLALGTVPPELPIPCIDLSYLSVSINFRNSKEISALLCLLRSSPNLQELEIWAKHEGQTFVGTCAYFWEDDNWTCSVEQLRFVRINCIFGIKPELEFIRFLLIHSPTLETMKVRPFDEEEGGLQLTKELLRFRRASIKAEIIFGEF